MGKDSRQARTAGIVLFGALLAILVGFYWPFLFAGKNFYLLDIGELQEPYLRFIADALRHGRLPLWNPYMHCGTSQMAIISPSAFHLFDSLFLTMNFSQAYAGRLILNQLLAGMGMYLLVLAVGWGTGPAILAASSFALSSYLFSLQNVSPWLETAAVAPLAVWAFLKIEQTKEINRQLIYTVFAGFMVLVLITSAPDLGAMVILMILFWRCLPGIGFLSNGRPNFRVLSLSLLSIGAGALLAMPQVLPVVEWIRYSPRAAGLGMKEMLSWSASWYDMVGFVLPQPLGDRNAYLNPLIDATGDPSSTSPLIASIFMGPVLVSLAALGFSDRRWRMRWVLLSASVLSALFALGSNFSAIPNLMQVLHLTSFFRYPIKLMFFPVLFITLASARGLKASSEVPVSAICAGLGGAWAMLAMVSTAVLMSSLKISVVHWYSDALGVVNLLLVMVVVDKIAWSALWCSGLGLIACGACYMVSRQFIGRIFFVNLVICTVSALFLWVAFTTLRHPGPEDFYSRPIALAEDLQGAAVRYGAGALRVLNLAQTNAVPREYLLSGDPTVNFDMFIRQMLEPMINMDAGISSALPHLNIGETLDHDYVAHSVYQPYDAGDDLPIARYCQMTATNFAVQSINHLDPSGYVIEPNRLLDTRYFQQIQENKPLNYRIYRVLNVLPRVRFARQVKWGKPHEAVLKFISLQDSSSFDPHQVTVLEHANPTDKGPRLPEAVAGLQEGTARIATGEAEKVAIEVETPTDNFLVLADTFYPGWTVTIDGRESTIVRADGLLRAVLIPAGKHQVEFQYQPESLRIGMVLGGLGLLIILVLAGCACCLRNAAQQVVSSPVDPAMQPETPA